MYLGLAVFYAGLTLLFDTAVPLLLLPLAQAAMQVLVIDREERLPHGRVRRGLPAISARRAPLVVSLRSTILAR
jgi:protein-S-isoprenylcysteine O-methyltransferase Ste14